MTNNARRRNKLSHVWDLQETLILMLKQETSSQNIVMVECPVATAFQTAHYNMQTMDLCKIHQANFQPTYIKMFHLRKDGYHVLDGYQHWVAKTVADAILKASSDWSLLNQPTLSSINHNPRLTSSLHSNTNPSRIWRLLNKKPSTVNTKTHFSSALTQPEYHHGTQLPTSACLIETFMSLPTKSLPALIILIQTAIPLALHDAGSTDSSLTRKMIGHETYHLLCLEISNHYSRSTFNRHLVYGCFDAQYFKALLHPMPALSFVRMECKVGHDCIQYPWMTDISSKKVAKYGLSSTQGLRLQETSVDLWATQEKLLLISLHNSDAKLTCRSLGKEKQAMLLLNNVAKE